ncbi:hypothetical protein OG365_40090 (plasmid) [Streptomyces sp. NBC_00853]|uniref:hypothetical protein n=1 Tax=Streptomyces sp. NBC_00853 TaxID=2903681 RepID=UPI002F90D91B|nr:hypothetical protein OG365_40090 [Streptomyces sp. NBC_00853]
MKDPFSSSEASTLLAPVGVVDRNAARRAVAARALDRADLAQLLDLLGLWPRDEPPAPGMAGTSPDSERGKDRPD